MVKASRADKQHIIHLLTHAFEQNQSVNYLVNSRNGIRTLMSYSFEICWRYGEVFLNEDRSACAMIVYPEQKKYSFFHLYQDLKLILFGIGLGNVSKAMHREALIKKIQPKEAICYLWFIGVLPMWQGKGSLLLEEIKDFAFTRQLPIYLETSTLENLPWYQKRGFEVYHQLDLGYVLYFLKCTNQ